MDEIFDPHEFVKTYMIVTMMQLMMLATIYFNMPAH